jgi:two-component system, OmpR family, sensor histidine kinase QseC
LSRAHLKPRSTRAVLLGGSIAVLIAVLGAAAWIGYDASEDEADELFDARLATSARVLAALYSTQPPRLASGTPIIVAFPAPLEGAPHDEAGPLGHYYETKIAFQVIDAQGRLVMRSASAPETPYAPLAPGFSTQKNWRVFTLRSGEVWVQAAERDDVRGELAGKLALAAVAPLVAGIPLVLLLLTLLIRYGLAPLADLAKRIARREPGSLAPIRLARSTAEIQPVLDELNALLERVQSAIARERRFTADAAHELRTPLAALKIHAQNALRATSEAERRASLERMMAGLERAIRLAEQMLAFSRAAARAPAAEPVSLRQAVEDALDNLLPTLKERGIKVSVAGAAPESEPLVQGERDKLATLARNLLETPRAIPRRARRCASRS